MIDTKHRIKAVNTIACEKFEAKIIGGSVMELKLVNSDIEDLLKEAYDLGYEEGYTQGYEDN